VLKVAGSKHSLPRNFSKTLSVHPVVNGYLALSRAEGNLKGSEKEEWYLHLSYTGARNKLALPAVENRRPCPSPGFWAKVQNL